jgi:uncharacterized repeat protein (TIGR03847 family)
VSGGDEEGGEVGTGAGEIRPVRSITVDAVGVPGARTFYLQAQFDDGKLVTLLIEKAQALILAEQIDNLFDEFTPRNSPLPAQMPELHYPKSVLFRAGKMGLQYNADVDLVGFDIAELRGIDQGTPAVLRLWVTRQQMRTLGRHAQRVAESGLPIG